MSSLDPLSVLDDDAAKNAICVSIQNRPQLLTADVLLFMSQTVVVGAQTSERRFNGIIKGFKPELGYGFISCPELQLVFGVDVQLYPNQVGGHSAGSAVSFRVQMNKDNKPQALDVQGVTVDVTSIGVLMEAVQLMRPLQDLAAAAKLDGMGGEKDLALQDCHLQLQDGFQQMPDHFTPGPHGKGPLIFIIGASGEFEVAGNAPMNTGGGWAQADFMGAGFQGDFMGGGIKRSASMMDGGGGERGPKPDVQTVLGSFTGRIKSFNENNGYGFIHCPALQESGYGGDIFLHRNQRKEFNVGDEVTFIAYVTRKGNVQSMELEPARR